MKVERNEIKTFIRYLKEIDYKPVSSKSKIVFPIDPSATKEVDGLSLDFVNNKFGSEKMPEPVLELRTDREGAYLAYCDLTFARKFDVVTFCELIGEKLSKKATETFGNMECYLVDTQNILIEFEI